MIEKPFHKLTAADMDPEFDMIGAEPTGDDLDSAQRRIFMLALRGDVQVGKRAAKEVEEYQESAKMKIMAEGNWTKDHDLVGNYVHTNRTSGIVISVSDTGKVLIESKIGLHFAVPLSAVKNQAIDQKKYRSRYEKMDVTTSSGRPAIGVKDGVTAALVGLDEGNLDKVCRENGIDPLRYSHLNPGMYRMTVANKLRGMLRRAEKVTVNGVQIDL